MCEYCFKNPAVGRFMWNIMKKLAGKKTAKVQEAISQQANLCANCAKHLGAWALPTKEEGNA